MSVLTSSGVRRALPALLFQLLTGVVIWVGVVLCVIDEYGIDQLHRLCTHYRLEYWPGYRLRPRRVRDTIQHRLGRDGAAWAAVFIECVAAGLLGHKVWLAVDEWHPSEDLLNSIALVWFVTVLILCVLTANIGAIIELVELSDIISAGGLRFTVKIAIALSVFMFWDSRLHFIEPALNAFGAAVDTVNAFLNNVVQEVRRWWRNTRRSLQTFWVEFLVAIHPINVYYGTMRRIDDGVWKTFLYEHVLHDIPDKVECQICLGDRFPHEMVQLMTCEHAMCRECTRGHARTVMGDGSGVFQCPFSNDCPDLDPYLLQRTFQYFPEDLYRLEHVYVHEGIRALDRDTVECPTPGCSAVMFSEELLSEDMFRLGEGYRTTTDSCDSRGFICDQCQESYCVLCLRPWTLGNRFSHDGISCGGYQRLRRLVQDTRNRHNEQRSVEMLERSLESNQAKRCPSCRTIIQKNGGCQHMRCRLCGHHFCWRCLRNYPVECTGVCLPLAFNQ